MRLATTSLIVWLAASVALAAKPPLAERQWKVDGVAREALVHAPATATKTKTPVVFAFHGHGGTMQQAARSLAIHKAWPEAIVVYMQGLSTPGRLTDPEGKKPGWQHDKGDQDDRDLKFFDAVWASLKTDVQVDERRVYATGHSNGGSFTYLLWATRGDLFAAVAPSGAVPAPGARSLKAKPVLHLAGEQDPLVKYAWQKLTIGALRRANGCEADGRPWAKAGDLVGTEFPSKTGTPVVTLIHPGGHTFPSEAPELIVKFFKEHEKGE